MFHFQKANFAYLRAVWHDRLRCITLAPNVKVKVSHKTRIFLEQVGLPINIDNLFGNVRFQEFQHQFEIIEYFGEEYIIIGKIGGSENLNWFPLVIRLSSDKVFIILGNIDNVILKRRYDVLFVNSSIQQYVICLLIHFNIYPALVNIVKPYRDDIDLFFSDEEETAWGDTTKFELNHLVNHIKQRFRVVQLQLNKKVRQPLI